MVAADRVVALGARGARERLLLALVDISADSVGHQDEALGADAEPDGLAFVNAFLVFRARVGGRAVDARQNAEVVLLLLEGARAAASVAETLQVSGALVLVDAGTRDGTFHVRIATQAARARAPRPVVRAATLGSPAAHAGLQARIVALLREGVASLAVLAVRIAAASRDGLAAASAVRVAHQAAGAVALVAPGKIGAGCPVSAGAPSVEAFVDIFALFVGAHVSRSAVQVFGALRQRH